MAKRKYHNELKTITCPKRGTITFHSTKEANRYKELSLLEDAEVVTDLELQVPFDVAPGHDFGGKKFRKCVLKVDFTYTIDGVPTAEDVKGMVTDDARVKLLVCAERHKDYKWIIT